MPKVSVYLPDELYRRARERNLPISALTQRAIQVELRARANDEWVKRVRSRPSRRQTDLDTAELMDRVREDFGA